MLLSIGRAYKWGRWSSQSQESLNRMRMKGKRCTMQERQRGEYVPLTEATFLIAMLAAGLPKTRQGQACSDAVAGLARELYCMMSLTLPGRLYAAEAATADRRVGGWQKINQQGKIQNKFTIYNLVSFNSLSFFKKYLAFVSTSNTSAQVFHLLLCVPTTARSLFLLAGPL